MKKKARDRHEGDLGQHGCSEHPALHGQIRVLAIQAKLLNFVQQNNGSLQRLESVEYLTNAVIINK